MMRTIVRSLQRLLISSIGCGLVASQQISCSPKDTPPQDSTQVQSCLINSKTVSLGATKTTEYWNYSKEGLLLRHWSPAGWQDDYVYDKDGFLLTVNKSGEGEQPTSKLTYQYANDRLTNITHQSVSGTTLFTQTFAYDSTGSLKQSILAVNNQGTYTSLFLAGIQTDYSYSIYGNRFNHAYEFEKGRIKHNRLAGSKEFSDYEYDSTGLLRRISTYQLSGVCLAYVSYDYQAGKTVLTSFVTPKGWPNAVKYNYNPDKGYYEFNSTNQSLGLVTNVSSYSGTTVNSVTKFSEQKIRYSLNKQGLPLEQNSSIKNNNGTTTSQITYAYTGCP